MTEQTNDGAQARVDAPSGILPAILALGAGGLCVGTGEFAPMSLLPDLAQGTGVSLPAAGGYISAYAAGVVVGAPSVAILTARWPRKLLLMTLLIMALIGYGLSAAAWNYPLMLAVRFIAGLPHGAWYGVASLVAASMVPAGQKARFIGYVMLGLAMANVAGVPMVTWAGQAFGWRMSFTAVTAGLVLTGILVLLFVPDMSADRKASPLKELSALSSPAVIMAFAVASVSFADMFAVYSFITPALTEVSKFELTSVPWILVLWGAGMVTGNIIGGRLADRAIIPAVYGMQVWNLVMLALFALVSQWKTPTLITLFFTWKRFLVGTSPAGSYDEYCWRCSDSCLFPHA